MNCEQALELIVAAIDREIDEDGRAALDAHLATCAECREAEAAMRKQDAELLRAFQADRDRAGGLAERVIADLSASSAVRPTSAQATNWVSLLLATAVGFVLAVLVFQPWDRAAPPVANGGGAARPPSIDQEVATVARLVEATGEVQLGGERARLSGQNVFRCPTDKPVRTEHLGRCELVTDAGCVIRMDGETELTFSAADSLKLQRGQIWCRLPKDTALEIAPGSSLTNAGESPAEAPTAWSCTNLSSVATFLTQIQPDGSVRVTPAGGEVSVKTASGTHHLKEGQAATITGERVETEAVAFHDPLDLWMMPLLMQKGHDDKELNERITQLLAGIGQTKMVSLYELEIRNLGEYGVLPLLRYVQSPMSKQEQYRRVRAMVIVSDLAPPWAIGDLVELLDDSNPDVRRLAAQALERMTGLNHGCSADMWGSASETVVQSRAKWKGWWGENSHRFPSPSGVANAKP